MLEIDVLFFMWMLGVALCDAVLTIGFTFSFDIANEDQCCYAPSDTASICIEITVFNETESMEAFIQREH